MMRITRYCGDCSEFKTIREDDHKVGWCNAQNEKRDYMDIMCGEMYKRMEFEYTVSLVVQNVSKNRSDYAEECSKRVAKIEQLFGLFY